MRIHRDQALPVQQKTTGPHFRGQGGGGYFLLGLKIPKLYGLVSGAGSGSGTVQRNRAGRDAILMAAEPRSAPGRRQVPQAERAVVGPREEQLASWNKATTGYDIRMTRERMPFALATRVTPQVPQNQAAIP